ncbi:substrate-binding periplasmic protein [Pseudomonadota bacterium]
MNFSSASLVSRLVSMLPRRTAQAAFFCALTSVCIAGVSSQAQAQDDKSLTLATLDWEPYTGSAMPGGGAVSAFISEALKSKGYATSYGFWPWKRAIVMAWRGQDETLGYFPGYHCHHNSDTDFVASKVIVNTQLGFVHMGGHPLPAWENLNDLSKVRIGYVTGYASTDEFEALEAAGTLRVFRTINDATNLKKLLKGQLDAVLIDRFVFENLVNADPTLQGVAPTIVFADKPLDTKPLHLCLRNDDQGRAVRDAFDAALAEMDADTFITKYFQNTSTLR